VKLSWGLRVNCVLPTASGGFAAASKYLNARVSLSSRLLRRVTRLLWRPSPLVRFGVEGVVTIPNGTVPRIVDADWVARHRSESATRTATPKHDPEHGPNPANAHLYIPKEALPPFQSLKPR
jgi:hypothetical protein